MTLFKCVLKRDFVKGGLVRESQGLGTEVSSRGSEGLTAPRPPFVCLSAWLWPHDSPPLLVCGYLLPPVCLQPAALFPVCVVPHGCPHIV